VAQIWVPLVDVFPAIRKSWDTKIIY